MLVAGLPGSAAAIVFLCKQFTMDLLSWGNRDRTLSRSRTWRQGSQTSLLSRSSSSGPGSPPRLPLALRGPSPHPNPPRSPFWREAPPTLPLPLSAPWPSRPRAPNLAPRPGLYSAAASAPAAVFPLRMTRPLGGPAMGAEFGMRPGSGFGPLAEQGASASASAGLSFRATSFI